MSSHTQKGTGLFQDFRKRVLNTLSGRRTITKKLMRPIQLSDTNQRRKDELTKKRRRTKAEDTELQVLSGKKAPRESNYKAQLQQALAERPDRQKKYNTYYNPKVALYRPSKSYPFIPGDTRRDARVDTDDLERINAQLAAAKVPETREYDKRTGAPATSATPNEYKQTLTLLQEELKDGYLRAFSYFYDRLHGVNTDTEEYWKTVQYATMAQVQDVIRTTRTFLHESFPFKEGLSQDDAEEYSLARKVALTNELFHTSIEDLNRDISKVERLGYAVPSPSNRSELRIANNWGKELNRYMPLFEGSARNLDYLEDISKAYGPAVLGVLNRPPLTNFQTPFSICLFAGSSHLQRFSENYQEGCSHFLVIDSLYTPSGKFNQEQGVMPVLLDARYFLTTSFVLDAFKEQAVEEMDEELFRLLETEAPQLIESSKVIVGTSTFFRRLPYSNVFSEHYIILAEDSFPEELAVTYKNPLLIPEVFSAMKKQRGFILCDPYTAYCTKKKNPTLWSEMVGMQFLNRTAPYNIGFSVYSMLTDTEKFFIDFYQFAQILDTLELRTNTGLSNQRLMAASDIYRQPINSSEFLEFIGENVDDNDEYFKQFLLLQKQITTYDTPIQNRNDVFSFLRKFRTLPIQIPPVSRPVAENNVEYLYRYENLQREVRNRRTGNPSVAPRNRPRESEPPALRLRVPAAPRNELTQLTSRIQHLKNERSALLRNPIVFNAASTTRKNRAAVNKQYANQLKRMGFLSRFTKGQQRKQLQLNQAAARKAFTNLNSLNQTIQQLEKQVATRYPQRNGPLRLPASPGTSGSTGRSSASSGSLPPFPG